MPENNPSPDRRFASRRSTAPSGEAFTTRAVHAGRRDFRELGVHAPPVDLSTTYPLGPLEETFPSFEALAHGEGLVDNPIYARLHNPTVARFEEALAELEGTEEAVAFGSGMAAITACLLAARLEGGHAVAVRPVYGGTDHVLDTGLMGIETTWATQDRVGEALRPDTSLVMIETPANPTLDLVDIAAVVEQATEAGRRVTGAPVPVLVDSTFATPVLLRPSEHGAALTVHSATKFLGGHGDVMGGVVATDRAWAQRLRRVRVATGGLLHPWGAYLLLRSLPTLPLRVARAQAGAEVLARALAEHPAVVRVGWPGLPGCDPRGLVGRQMSGPGSLLCFELPSFEAAAAVMDRVRLLTPAVSLGATDSLIQHPAGLTHRLVDPEAKARTGISPGLLRVSVGLEDPEDLWLDLAAALEGISAAAPSSEESMAR